MKIVQELVPTEKDRDGAVGWGWRGGAGGSPEGQEVPIRLKVPHRNSPKATVRRSFLSLPGLFY